MKNFKLLLASMVFACFFFANDLNAQGATSHWDQYTLLEGDFNCYCAGESLIGDYWEHTTENKNFISFNWKGELTGADTQKKYTFLGTAKVDKTTLQVVVQNMRVIGEDGIVTLMHLTYRNELFFFECK